MSQLAGLILCGGHSRRMGRPKALLPFGDQTLLERIVERMAPAASPIVVVAAVDQPLPPLPPEVTIVRDDVPDQGPLAGLVSGLRRLPESAAAAFVSGCDAPFVSAETIRWLAERLADHDAVVPLIAGRPQPLAAVYRVGVLVAADKMLAAKNQRLLGLLDRLRVLWVEAHEFSSVSLDLDFLINLNDPESYHTALQRAGL